MDRCFVVRLPVRHWRSSTAQPPSCSDRQTRSYSAIAHVSFDRLGSFPLLSYVPFRVTLCPALLPMLSCLILLSSFLFSLLPSFLIVIHSAPSFSPSLLPSIMLMDASDLEAANGFASPFIRGLCFRHCRFYMDIVHPPFLFYALLLRFTIGIIGACAVPYIYARKI